MGSLVQDLAVSVTEDKGYRSDYRIHTFPRKMGKRVVGLEHKLEAERKRAFLLVDMLESFLGEIDNVERYQLVKNQIEVLEYCAKHDIPVAVLEFLEYGETIPALRDRALRVPRHAFFAKTRNDGFARTRLSDQLYDWLAQEIYFMGVNASFCVKETAQGALLRGLRVVTADCLIADRERDKAKAKSRDWFSQNGLYLMSY